mgnify:CR=1 FL=1
MTLTRSSPFARARLRGRSQRNAENDEERATNKSALMVAAAERRQSVLTCVFGPGDGSEVSKVPSEPAEEGPTCCRFVPLRNSGVSE